MLRSCCSRLKLNHEMSWSLLHHQRVELSSWTKSQPSPSVSSAQYCLESVRKYDYENFLSTLLLNGEQRRECFAVRAFNVEISRISSVVSDDKIGLLRLKFWQQALDDMYNNKIDGSYTVPEHPVLQELYNVVSNKKLTKRYLQRLITARNRNGNQLFLSTKELEDYCENSTSSLYYLLLEIFNTKNVHADHAASHLGKAQGIVNLLRSIRYLDRSRAIPIPQDILIKHGTSHERILRNKVDDKGVEECVFDVATTAHQHLEKSRNLSKTIPKVCKILFLPGLAIERYLERLRKVNFHLTNQKLQRRDTMLPLVYYLKKLLNSY